MNGEFESVPVTPFIGAEITGLDLSQPIPGPALEKLRDTWHDRKALFFRNQTLNPDEQVAFTRQFGDIDKYPFLVGVEQNPYVAPVLKEAHDKVNFGGVWHSDTTYLDMPAKGASLYAVEIPPIGGDTIFVDMEQAYEHLSEGLKSMLSQMRAVNTSEKADVSKTREDRLADHGDGSTPKSFANSHPVVRTHPETGRKCLYINEGHTSHFEGWTEEESTPLLEYLYQHQRKAEFQCRLRWGQGTLALWDNRSTHHYPINDYHGHRRLMHRVSLKCCVPM